MLLVKQPLDFGLGRVAAEERMEEGEISVGHRARYGGTHPREPPLRVRHASINPVPQPVARRL